MPSSERPFTLQTCPDGFPAALLPDAAMDHAAHIAHHVETTQGDTPKEDGTHDHDSWRKNHCAFAGVASAPPIAEVIAVAISLETATVTDPEYSSPSFKSPHFLLAQPRAPPILA